MTSNGTVMFLLLLPALAVAQTASGCLRQTRCVSFVGNQSADLLNADGNCKYGRREANGGNCATECNVRRDYVCECVSQQVAEEKTAGANQTILIGGAVGTAVGLVLIGLAIWKCTKDAAASSKVHAQATQHGSSKCCSTCIMFTVPIVITLTALMAVLVGVMNDTSDFWVGCG